MQESIEETTPTPFKPEEMSQIEAALNMKYVDTVDDFLLFGTTERNGLRQRDTGIPVSTAREILQAVNRKAERMADYEGWIDPQKGLAEFEVRQQGIGTLRRATVDRFTFETHPCTHSHISNPPVEYDEERNSFSPVIRVTSSDGSTCIEVSPNSSLCFPMLPLNLDSKVRMRSQPTLKVFLDGATERNEMLRKSQELANSFLFELNARNRITYSLRPRVEGTTRRRRGLEISHTIRFPKTPIPENIAALFSNPSDFAMRGNHTLFYLSYYQILEHYLPAVHRRETVRKVRRILRSLDFDETKDSSVLQILNSIERSRGASEGEQLRTVIEECVPENKLQEFLTLDHNGHFEKGGPISGVAAINFKSGESLASQVAKRVYMLRNRIVHAKDDVRYAESKVLLPLSHEALMLYPDIELLRLLAIEVIVDNQ